MIRFYLFIRWDSLISLSQSMLFCWTPIHRIKARVASKKWAATASNIFWFKVKWFSQCHQPNGKINPTHLLVEDKDMCSFVRFGIDYPNSMGLGLIVHTWNRSMWKIKAGDQEFKAFLRYVVRLRSAWATYECILNILKSEIQLCCSILP